MLAIVLIWATPAIAATTADITVSGRVTGTGIGPPVGLTLTDLGLITVQADWTAGVNATYTKLVGNRNHVPATPTDGELLYYGPSVSANISGVDLEVITMYVIAISYGSDNVSYSPHFASASIGGVPMTDLATNMGLLAQYGLLAALGLIATALTAAMFLRREPMLGFPSAIFWGFFGGYSYTLGTAPTDFFRILAFASLLGMMVFAMYSAYAVRKRDLDMRKQDMLDYGVYIDEVKPKKSGGNGHSGDDIGADVDIDEDKERLSSRRQGIQDRARSRRSGVFKKKIDWSNFR